VIFFLEIAPLAVLSLLADETNVDLRRCLSVFLATALKSNNDLDDIIAKPLISEFHQTDNAMVIDAVSYVLTNSYLQRMTDAEKLAIHERLKGMKRPGLLYLELAARV
jgi:hypothetical protein